MKKKTKGILSLVGAAALAAIGICALGKKDKDYIVVEGEDPIDVFPDDDEEVEEDN